MRAAELLLAAASVAVVCGVLEAGLRVRDWREARGSLERRSSHFGAMARWLLAMAAKSGTGGSSTASPSARSRARWAT